MRIGLIFGVLAASAALPARAQETAGVTPYPAAYFASLQPTNALEMIQRLPGFTFDGGDSVRGFDGAAGNVLIGGQRPSSKTDSLEEILRRFPASQVERIDVIRGGAPGIDMQGKSVLANIVLKSGAATAGLISVADRFIVHDGRHLPGLRIEGSRRTADTSLEASLLAGQGPDDGAGDGFGLIQPADGSDPTLYNLWTEGQGSNIALTAAYERPVLGGRLRVNGRAFQDHFEYHELARVVGSGDESREHDRDTVNQYEAGARFTRPLGASASLEALALQTLESEDLVVLFETPDDAARFALNTESGETIGRGVLKHRRSATLSFEAGAEGAFNWLESQTAFDVDGVPVPLPAANVRVEEARGEAFATVNWTASPTLGLEAKLKGEASRVTSEGDVELEKTLYFIKPRVAVTWSPNGGRQLRLRVEREVGQLDFDDFVASSEFNTGGVQTGNPDLEPEQAWVAEAAFEQRFWTSGSLVLTVRRSELTDVADRAPIFVLDDPLTPEDEADVFDQPANIGEGWKNEVVVGVTLPLDKLFVPRGLLKGELTWRETEVTDPTTGEGRPISGLHPLDWELHFSQDVPSWKLNWGVDAWGAWRETFYRFDRIDSFKLKTFVTPYVEYKPRRDLTFRFEVQNITSRGFTQVSEVYDGPRSTVPLGYTEVRDRQFGPMLYLRVRKIFG